MNKTTQKTTVLLLSTCLTSLLLGGVVVGGVLHYLKNDPNATLSKKEAKSSPVRRSAALVRTTDARWDELGTVRTYHGRFVQVQGGTISSEVSGMVRDLPVEAGTPVVGGKTTIAKIDNTWTKLDLERAETEISSIRIQLRFEENELRRITPLVRSMTVTESDFLTQQARVDELKAQLDRALVVKKEAEEKLKRTIIYAPFDGHIVSKSAEIGDLLTPGTPIVTTVSSGKIDAVVNVSESVVDRLKIGDRITIFVDQLHTKASGEVHAIVPYASTAARFFPVYVRMDDQGGRFKVGMSVTALVQTVEPKMGIVIPLDAVIDKADGQTVWVVQDRQAEKSESDDPNKPAELQNIAIPVPVRIIATAMDQLCVEAETEEGKTALFPGVKVVIEGGERLMPNQVVELAPNDPTWFEGLPDGSGHTVIAPKKRLTERM